MTINLCIVTEFEQHDFFQWTIALQTYPEFCISSVVMNPDTIKLNDKKSHYWNPIRDADIVFVYCVRHNLDWKWYNLPLKVKEFMNKKARMICQFDLEFLWFFHHDHFPWKKIDQWTDGISPKKFFKKTGILDVADAYIIFFNPKLKAYTSKPVFNIPLPQLIRYQNHLSNNPSRNVLSKKSRRIAVIHHSVKSAKIEHTLNKIIKKSDRPVTIFTCRNSNPSERLELIRDIPSRADSRVYGHINRNDYMTFLEDCRVAIDDNEGYYGWSRFVMECALAYVPCVGSTLAVKEFFPKLYTKHKDYNEQAKLINHLYNDNKFWMETVINGKNNVLIKLNTDKLVGSLLKVIKRISPQKSILKTKPPKITPQKSDNIIQEYSYKEYKDFCTSHYPHSIPRRPNKGESVHDGILKEFLNQKQWDEIYGKWKRFIDGTSLPHETVTVMTPEFEKSEITKPIYATVNLPACTIYRHKSGLTFSIPTPDISDLVSFYGEGFFIKEMIRQSSIDGDELNPNWIFCQLAVNGLPIKHVCTSNIRKSKICARMIDLHHFPEQVVNRLNKRKISVLFTTYRYVPYKITWHGGPIFGAKKIDKDYYWKNIKAKIFWLPHSFAPDIFHPPSSEQYDYHIFALGVVSEVYPLRMKIFPKLRHICNKNKWKLYMKPRPPFFDSIRKLETSSTFSAGKEYARALRVSKVCIFGNSILKYPIKKWFEALGSGTCILADEPQTSKELGLIDGENYVKINAKNWESKLTWVLQNDVERKRIANNGLELAIKHHTNEVRVKQMFDILRNI